MRAMARISALFLTAVWMLGLGAPAANAGSGMCAMGGSMIVTEVDRDKALAWARARARAEVNDAGANDWSVLTLSVAEEGIGLLVEPGHVFFGVAGRGGETYPRDIEKAFGKDFTKLRGAVAKTLSELVAAGVVKLEAKDIQALAGTAGLGVLEKGAGGWALTPRDCQAVDLPTSGL